MSWNDAVMSRTLASLLQDDGAFRTCLYTDEEGADEISSESDLGRDRMRQQDCDTIPTR